MRDPLSTLPPASDPRWTALDPDPAAGGSLSVYFSDPLAAVPVREITRPGDNKADPNLETGTYGLVSTCGRALRSAFVRHRREALFFTTTWDGRRVLAGYYLVGWHAPVPGADRDFALAARALRFDPDPLSLSEVDAHLGTRLDRRFRSSLRLTPDEVGRLRDLLDGRPEGTDRYLGEIDRIERFNARYGGHRYVARRRDEPFAWADADTFLASPDEAAHWETDTTLTAPVSNATPSGWWTCSACGEPHANKARLRQCPTCGLVGTVAPLAHLPELTTT